MIVPKYWAESKTTKKINGRQFTIKRFGWSDVSAADAKENADARLDEAVKELDAHGTVRRIDHKVPYNGAEGIPIREEVIATHRDVVITRNSYGALCLNTPDVLFADIDRNTETPRLIKNFSIILLSVLALLVGLSVQSWELLLGALVVAVICNPILAHMVNKILIAFAGGPEKATMRKIVQMSQKNPELNIRLYRTPLGFRALLMNDLYVPNSDNALRILRALNSDRVYIQMCKNQNCFRARVSPKPWRIGVERLRSGVWPISPEKLASRAEWTNKYDKASRDYASCHFVANLGSDKVHEKAEFVRKLHDDFCKACRDDLKIA